METEKSQLLTRSSIPTTEYKARFYLWMLSQPISPGLVGLDAEWTFLSLSFLCLQWKHSYLTLYQVKDGFSVWIWNRYLNSWHSFQALSKTKLRYNNLITQTTNLIFLNKWEHLLKVPRRTYLGCFCWTNVTTQTMT